MKPLVSIIMPFHNAAATIEAALRSVQGQVLADWEMLLCDDGSSDDSLRRVRQFGDSRFLIWAGGARKGLASRLNECIDHASGQYIARMDSDDICYPQRLAAQVAFLERHRGVHLTGCDMLIFGEGGEPLGRRVLPEDHEAIVAAPALGFGLAHPTWMGRAEWFRQHRYRPAALRFEDVELLYRSYATSRFANVPQVLHGYRELRNGFRKRLKTRIGRVRFLNACSATVGSAVFWKAVAAESCKAVSDATLVMTSLRYQMLRARERKLTSAEGALWREVYAAAAGKNGGERMSA